MHNSWNKQKHTTKKIYLNVQIRQLTEQSGDSGPSIFESDCNREMVGTQPE